LSVFSVKYNYNPMDTGHSVDRYTFNIL